MMGKTTCLRRKIFFVAFFFHMNFEPIEMIRKESILLIGNFLTIEVRNKVPLKNKFILFKVNRVNPRKAVFKETLF